MAALQQRDGRIFSPILKEEEWEDIHTKADPAFSVFTSGDSAGFVYSDAADSGIAV